MLRDVSHPELLRAGPAKLSVDMVLSARASLRSMALASPGETLEPHPAHEERDAFTPDVESATKH